MFSSRTTIDCAKDLPLPIKVYNHIGIIYSSCLVVFLSLCIAMTALYINFYGILRMINIIKKCLIFKEKNIYVDCLAMIDDL